MADNSYTVNELATGPTTITAADDGSGFDKIVVTGSYIEQVEIDLGWTTTDGLPTSAEGLYFNETGGHRLIVTGVIEEAVGSDSRDFIQGNELDNVISGEALFFGVGGNDVLWGLGGNDAIHGCMGDDSIQGDEGDDLLYGDSGSDLISGDAGVDNHRGRGRGG